MNRRFFLLGSLLLSYVPTLSAASEKEYSLIIIGSGAAGLSAAAAAAETGLKDILVIEKAPFIGGHTALSGGSVNAVDPEMQLRQGIKDSPELWEQQILETGAYRNDPALVRTLVSNAYPTFQWLSGLGIPFQEEVFEAWSGKHKRAHSAGSKRNGMLYLRTLNRHARDLGVQMLLNTKAERLIFEDGRVQGISVIDKNKQQRLIRAKAVLIATGGFTGNISMRMRYDQRLDGNIRSTADPNGTGYDSASGDGILMAETIGAKTVDMDAIQLIPLQGGRLLDYVGGDIFLDSSGKRFVDESAEVRFVSEAFLNLPDRVMWVVTDAQSTKNSGLEAKLLTGVVDTAGSIQELADKMGVDRAVLKYTIDRYNKFAEQGRDEDFGKTTFTQKIEKPPFYFGKERFDAHFSCGGLKINPSAQVLDQADRPIKNLYAAGEVTGGIHGADRLGGDSLISCFVFGRIAGLKIAEELNRR